MAVKTLLPCTSFGAVCLELISQLRCALTSLSFVFSPFQAPGFLPLGHSAGVLGAEGLQP